jgi:hypothetical protein
MFIAISEKVTKPLRWRVHYGFNGVTFERAALWGRTNGNHAPPLNGRVRALQRGGGCADRFDWKTALRRRTPRGYESPDGRTSAAARLVVQRGSVAGAVRIVRGGPGRTRCRGGAGCAWQRGAGFGQSRSGTHLRAAPNDGGSVACVSSVGFAGEGCGLGCAFFGAPWFACRLAC